jgi:ABC-2 type transport system permease protein
MHFCARWLAVGAAAGCTAAFLGGAVIAYDPARGMLMRRGG